ncbi:unnamed protein product, partial [Brachionus calyciflorus]
DANVEVGYLSFRDLIKESCLGGLIA